MDDLPLATLLIVVGFAAWIAVIDWRHFRIPNALTLPFAIAGLAINVYSFGLPGIATSLGGLAVGFLLLLIPYLMGGFGGGDVKLLAAIGSWVGAGPIIQIFLVSAVMLGVVSAIMILSNRDVRHRAWLNLQLAAGNVTSLSKSMGGQDRVEQVVRGDKRKGRAVPFGIMIAAGILFLIALRAYSDHALGLT